MLTHLLGKADVRELRRLVDGWGNAVRVPIVANEGQWYPSYDRVAPQAARAEVVSDRREIRVQGTKLGHDAQVANDMPALGVAPGREVRYGWSPGAGLRCFCTSTQ